MVSWLLLLLFLLLHIDFITTLNVENELLDKKTERRKKKKDSLVEAILQNNHRDHGHQHDHHPAIDSPIVAAALVEEEKAKNNSASLMAMLSSMRKSVNSVPIVDLAVNPVDPTPPLDPEEVKLTKQQSSKFELNQEEQLPPSFDSRTNQLADLNTAKRLQPAVPLLLIPLMSSSVAILSQQSLDPVSKYRGNIYLTWHLSSDKFHYLNYKSFESLLLTYPNSMIVIFIIAPSTADYYKVGKILSKTTFQKYSKRLPNNISFQVIHHSIRVIRNPSSSSLLSSSGGGNGSFSSSSFHHSIDDIPGYETYWKPAIEKYCEKQHPNSFREKSPAPYHLHLYYVFLQLYQSGGLFTDFSWIHQFPFLPLDDDSAYFDQHKQSQEYAAYYLKTVCLPAIISSNHPAKKERGSSSARKVTGMKCDTSTILAFSAKHVLLQCILQNFNESFNPFFKKCLEVDRVSGGAFCIEHEIQTCFMNHDYVNPFEQYYREATKEKKEESSSLESDARSNNRKESSDIMISSLQWTRTSCYYMSEKKDNVVTRLFKDRKNDCPVYPVKYEQYLFQNYTTLLSPLPADYNLNDSFARNASSYFETKQPIFPVIWLGLSSFSGDWDMPSPDSLLDYLIHRNNLLLQGRMVFDPHLSNGFTSLDQKLVDSLPHCHPYSYPLPPATSRTSTSTLTTLYQRSQLSCAPSFIIPGFMKAGTSFFYDMILHHPLLIKALSGVQFKETGCYLDLLINQQNSITNNNYKTSFLKKKGKLMNCFPFVEDRDHVYYGDATVYYSTREMIPYYLAEDNPNMKILFSLRNPIQRSLSHHRFGYRYYLSHEIGNMNDCLAFIFADSDQILMKWWQLAKEILSTTDEEEKERLNKRLIASYFEGLGGKNKSKKSAVYSRCGHLVLYSLYYMPIYHWYTIFPKENIRLMNIEFLHAKYFTNQEIIELLTMSPVIEKMNWTRLFDYSSSSASRSNAVASSRSAAASYIDSFPDNDLATRKRRRTLKQEQVPLPVPQYQEELADSEDLTVKEAVESNVQNDDILDTDYLLHQLNGIYKFLGIPPIYQIVEPSDKHETRDEVPVEHQLNETMKQRLIEYYHPFNQLLQQFIEKTYSDSALSSSSSSSLDVTIVRDA